MKKVKVNVITKVNENKKEVEIFVNFNKIPENLPNEVKAEVYNQIENEIANRYPKFELKFNELSDKEFKALKKELDDKKLDEKELENLSEDEIEEKVIDMSKKRIMNYLNCTEGALIKDLIKDLTGREPDEVIENFLKDGAIAPFALAVILDNLIRGAE